MSPNPLFPDWTRTYTYATNSNRLLSTAEPIGVTPAIATYGYEGTNGAGGAHGSMTSMGHLSLIEWDYADRMQHVARGSGGGDVYFNYDSSGQRVRKVYEHGSYIEQRIYLGGYEIYRRTDNGVLDVHRRTLHVMDNQKRVAMVETTLSDTDSSMLGTRWRFQLNNHLGSTALETDAPGRVISYEEYHPYGTTAFRLAEDDAHVPAKRYRYTGKERDEETSLYYHGARYYAPWLGRWTAADPAWTVDGPNLYRYSHNNSVRHSDPSGTQTAAPKMDVPPTQNEPTRAAKSAIEIARERWAPKAIPRVVPSVASAPSGLAAAAIVKEAALAVAYYLALKLYMQRTASIVKYGNPWGVPKDDLAFPLQRYLREQERPGSRYFSRARIFAGHRSST